MPTAIADAAAQWSLTVTGYHDGGCASVIALASDGDHVSRVIKAWYDPDRYRHEVAALRLWGPPLAPAVTHAADHLAMAALRLIADRPGGAAAPADEYEVLAHGLYRLHSCTTAPEGFPSLEGYIDGEVRPRIHRRTSAIGAKIPESCLIRGMAVVNRLPMRLDERGLLHADLYQENVLFDQDGRSVFIDPLPMTGDPVFDWAFWTVYYDLARDPSHRLLTAARVGGICLARLLPWCLMLCLDGLLYYVETADLRVTRMIEVMTVLGDIWVAACA
ncbi:MAG TPA: phosphotransferase [Streptosporangiaceae bacterium]